MLSALAVIVPGIVKAQTPRKGLKASISLSKRFDNGPDLGFSREDVEPHVLVAIKRDLPKLPVGKRFTAYIYVRLTSVNITGWVASFVEVQLRRPMHILRENYTDTNMLVLGSV